MAVSGPLQSIGFLGFGKRVSCAETGRPILTIYGRVRLSDPDQDSRWISIQTHLANRMTLD